MFHIHAPFLCPELPGTGRILAPVSALLVPEEGQADDTTKPFSSTTSRIELPKSETNIRRGTATGTEDNSPNVARTLRSLVDAELCQTSSRLF